MAIVDHPLEKEQRKTIYQLYGPCIFGRSSSFIFLKLRDGSFVRGTSPTCRRQAPKRPEGETLKTDGGGFRDVCSTTLLGMMGHPLTELFFLMKPRSQMM